MTQAPRWRIGDSHERGMSRRLDSTPDSDAANKLIGYEQQSHLAILEEIKNRVTAAIAAHRSASLPSFQ